MNCLLIDLGIKTFPHDGADFVNISVKSALKSLQSLLLPEIISGMNIQELIKQFYVNARSSGFI
jgi:hypothetical protein